MIDPGLDLLRVAIVAGVAVAALMVGMVARSRVGSATVRRRGRYPGLTPGLTLFESATCETCAVARAVLDRLGLEYRRVGWETEADLFGRLRIERVPTLVLVDASSMGWKAEGIPECRRLSRWLVGTAVGG